MLDNQTLQEMLNNIPDEKVREKYGNIINGTIVGEVYCLSEACNGKLIGFIHSDGTVIEEPTSTLVDSPVGEPEFMSKDQYKFEKKIGASNFTVIEKIDDTDEKEGGYLVQKTEKIQNHTSGIATSRDRLDGQKGFKCHCGNTSLLAFQEQGIISSNPPTKRDLELIAENIQKLPTNYVEVDGIKEVDGFRIKRLVTQ